MIEWASPWAFVLLVPVLLLPLQSRLTGRNRLAVPTTAMRYRPTLRGLSWWVPAALQLVGLTLLVLALARPRITRRDVVLESEGLDILLVVDTSGSMKARDFTLGRMHHTRLEVAKGVLAEFVAERPYDRIGVVVFGSEAFTLVPLTLDHDTLVQALDLIEIGMAGGHATAIGAALEVAAARMTRVEAPERVIILLTDGQNNVERPDPRQVAQAAAALDMRLYTVGIGRSGGGPEGVDAASLRYLADITGGQFFLASDTDELRGIYATIGELETSPAEVRELVEHDERFRRYLVPGLALLAAQVLLAGTWLRRGP